MKYKSSGGGNDLYSYKKKMVGNTTFKMSDWLKRRQELGKPAGYGSYQIKYLTFS